jgi:outer membrane protein TolC
MSDLNEGQSAGGWGAGWKPVLQGLIVTILVIFAGCADYGVGGTGELVVPQQTFHEFDELQLQPAPATAPTTFPATAPVESVELTIEQVRRDALANNLDLQVQFFDPTIASEALKAERAKFEAVFTTDARYSRTDAATASQLQSSQAESFSVTPGLNIPLITGGNVRVDMPMSRFETNNQFSTLNPSYTSDVEASISIPLMRGFGVAPNAQSIRIAFYESQAAQARTKLEVIRVLTDAEKTYWLLYSARRVLEVNKKEYDLAVAQLERARRQVRAGTVAEVEITRAESGVADTVESIIIAENTVRLQQRTLKRIINREDLPVEFPTVVVPATVPDATPYSIDADQLVKLSMHERMELLQTELTIASENANIDAAKNATLPLVSFQYQYGINGLGGEFNDALAQVNDKRFEQHSAGLQLEVPIGNEPARARLRSALLSRLRTLATKQQQEVQISQEVFNAVDTLQAAWQSILAAQKRTILNARLLDVEIRQFEQGLRTSTDVLDAQTKLADAQSAEIRAITAYQIAQVDLAFATGTVLGQAKVDWAPMKSPKG